MTLHQMILAVTPDDSFGRASAVKRGRNPRFPYVPVIVYADGDRTHNPLQGNAFATREEAVACAQRCIDSFITGKRADLANPRYRALRESLGLPREI
jgi:hypothetical protein